MEKPARALGAFVLALGLVLSAAPAGAKTDPKKPERIKPCSLLKPEDLETVFEQPFRTGVSSSGSGCNFGRPEDSHIPDIVVAVLLEQLPTVKAAKAEFQHSTDIYTELAGSVKKVPAVGDEAFAIYFIGTDEMSVRVGKLVAEVRVDRTDDAKERYPEQTAAVATLLATGMAAAQP